MKTQNLKLLSATVALSVIGLVPMACSSDKAAAGPDGGTATHHGGSSNHGGTANQGDGGPSGGAGGSHGGSTSHGGSSGNTSSDSGAVDAGDSGRNTPVDAGPACTAVNADGCYESCEPQTTDNSEQFLNHCTTADCTPWTGTLSKLGAGGFCDCWVEIWCINIGCIRDWRLQCRR
jgi:hypothetical protein